MAAPLAGAPELLARYRIAPPAAAALMNAGADARRLGMGIALPLTFLERAAPGYLTGTEWDGLAEDWLEQGLAYTAARARASAARWPASAPAPPRPGSVRGPAYRLADYLEQHGRRTRRPQIPPADYWEAAARFAKPADLPALAWAAENRGLLRDVTRLRKHAVGHGDISEAVVLVRNWYSLHPRSADPRPAHWAAAPAALDDPDGVAWLLGALRDAGARQQVADLLARDPAGHAALDNPYPGSESVAVLLDALRKANAKQQAGALVDRLPAEGRFDLFLRQPEYEVRYRFGRELDGSPALSWGWDDLD